MLFIHPMWDSESERIGKQKCTSVGYAIHHVAESIGYLGLLFLVTVIGVLLYQVTVGAFHISLLWLLAIPFTFGVVSEVLFQFSWHLAFKKGWRYNDLREASWMEGDERVTYKYPP